MTDAIPQADILYIEDNINDAELAIRALTRNNITSNILYVPDAQQALDYIFAEGDYIGRNTMVLPRLILLDLKMPKLDGSDLLKLIRANERTRDIPVVILSSSKEEKDVSNSFRLGANSYVVKPIEFEKFTRTVIAIGHYWLSFNETVRCGTNN